MKAQSMVSLGLWAGAVTLSLIAWRCAREARRVREARVETETKLLVAQAESAHVAERLAAVERERESTQTTLEALKNSPVMAGPAKPPAATGPRSLSILEMFRDAPDVQAYYLEHKRAQLAATYGPLFRTLGLSAEAVSKFQDNSIRREAARMDLENVLGTQGEESATAVEKLRVAADSNYNDAQRALLGEAGFAQLQAYEGVAWWRSNVSAMAGVAAVEHVPLSAAQADALVEAFHGSNSPQRGIDWAAFDARARAILTPEQFEVVHTMDPGPTRAGLLQSRLYDSVEKSKREEEKAAAPTGSGTIKPAG